MLKQHVCDTKIVILKKSQFSWYTVYVIKGCPIWLKFQVKFSKRYLVDSWKIVSKINRIGQLFTTYKKEAITRYSRNG